MKHLSALFLSFLYFTSIQATTASRAGEERIGIVIEPTVLYIGHPERENAMPYLRIAQGTEVKIIGEEAPYFKIVHKELIGYVKSKAVKPLEELDEPVAAPRAVEEKPRYVAPVAAESGYYTLTEETSLREGPDSKARVMARFDPGDRVEVLDDSGKYWWKVVYNGKTGWAKAALLRKE
ncbi:MAG: SH3 domain-containing protein [Saprospiraceae bacterium]